VRSEGERPHKGERREGEPAHFSREWACVSRAKPRFASSSASRALCGGGGSVGKLLRRTLHASHRITQTIDGAAARVQNRVFSMRFSVDLSGPMPRPASRNSWLFYWELSLGMSNTMLLILLTFLMLRDQVT